MQVLKYEFLAKEVFSYKITELSMLLKTGMLPVHAMIDIIINISSEKSDS